MIPEKQKIVIAEACGWVQCLNIKHERYLVHSNANIKGTLAFGFEPLSESALNYVPDYLNDLNAMHEAVLKLPKNKRSKFAETLFNLASSGINEEEAETHDFLEAAITAECELWAEAFLKTLGLWEE